MVIVMHIYSHVYYMVLIVVVYVVMVLSFSLLECRSFDSNRSPCQTCFRRFPDPGSDSISQLKLASVEWLRSLSEHRTAMLWLMYIKLVAILHTFIRAGHTGNWLLYLQALQQILPYLAAPGHYKYTKPHVLFTRAGIYSDLYIEQDLIMLSPPACAEVNRAIREVTGLQDTSDAEVNKDRSAARMTRDAKDVQTILHYLSEWKPFSKHSKELRSLSSGVIVDKSLNVDKAESVGQAIVQIYAWQISGRVQMLQEG